ncbi:hypothetical protein KR074_002857 [Drosophila pseudoananassae]|nr:hypothetical protein KR074_002857 [Drosophila pseudoananassae]
MVSQLDIRVEKYPIFEPLLEVEEVSSITRIYDVDLEVGESALGLYMMSLTQDHMPTDVAEEKLKDDTKDEPKDDEPNPKEVMEDVPKDTTHKDSSDPKENIEPHETLGSALKEVQLTRNSSKCELGLDMLGSSQDGDMSTDGAEEKLKDDTKDEPKDDEPNPKEVMEDVPRDTTHKDSSDSEENIEPHETLGSALKEVKLTRNSSKCELGLDMLGSSQDGDTSTDVTEEKLKDDTKDEPKDDEPNPKEVMEDVPKDTTHNDSRDPEENIEPHETLGSALKEVKLTRNSSKCELGLDMLGSSQDGDMSTDGAEEKLKDDTKDEPKDDEPNPKEVMEDVPKDTTHKESSDPEEEIETENPHETLGSALKEVKKLTTNSPKCEIDKPTEPRCMLISGKRAKLQIYKDLRRKLEEIH